MKSPDYSVRRDDLTRDIVLDCEKNGTITFRNKADTLPDGVLPFFSVYTAAEAEAVIIRLCKLQYQLHPRTRAAWYRITDLGSGSTVGGGRMLEIDDIGDLADRFRNAWFDIREKEAMQQRKEGVS